MFSWIFDNVVLTVFKWYNYLQQHSCLLERACWFTHIVFQALSSTWTQLHQPDLPPPSPQRDFVYMLCFGFLHTNWFKHYSCWHANTIQYSYRWAAKRHCWRSFDKFHSTSTFFSQLYKPTCMEDECSCCSLSDTNVTFPSQ